MRRFLLLWALASGGCQFGDDQQISIPSCDRNLADDGTCLDPLSDGGVRIDANRGPNKDANDSLDARPHLPSECGNGDLEFGEVCDDGNLLDGDGCTSDCQIGAIVGCDILNQGGCPAGMACDFQDDAALASDTECRPANGGGEGSSCSDSEDCAAGLGCIDDPQGATCRRYCEDTSDCSAPGGGCALLVTKAVAGVATELPLRVCTINCILGETTGCSGGRHCTLRYSFANPGSSYSDCEGAGPGGEYDACNAYSRDECQVGLSCVPNYFDQWGCMDLCIGGSSSTCNLTPGSPSCKGIAEVLNHPNAYVGSTLVEMCF